MGKPEASGDLIPSSMTPVSRSGGDRDRAVGRAVEDDRGWGLGCWADPQGSEEEGAVGRPAGRGGPRPKGRPGLSHPFFFPLPFSFSFSYLEIKSYCFAIIPSTKCLL